MPNFFISRPNLAWVVAIFIVLAGLLALPLLPVSQYPNVAPPQISIYTTYPGASASTVVDAVTNVIEEELNGAKGLMYFESSSSSQGTVEITVTFAPGVDPDQAQVDVQNRLKKAEARLPREVVQQGIQVEQASSGFLLIYEVSSQGQSQERDVIALSDYAVRNINPELRRIEGVGKIQFFSSEAAMRVWLDPNKLVSYGLSVEEVNRAIAGQNLQIPAGSFGGLPGALGQELSATIAVQGMLSSADEFERIILSAKPDGSTVRLKDVARLEIGAQDYTFALRSNGQPSTGGAIILAPGANAIATAKKVKQRLAELSQDFPEGMHASINYDTSTFVEVAISKVLMTLLEAAVLVFVVIFLFLQNIRYTFIPSIVVPVCLAGTLAVMYALGYSVNMMTMFGMVLAIGILVDDAIVVVENVERIMSEQGLAPLPATIKAMGEVSGAIVGITLVLSAVFIPLAFMSGSVGVIYQQFSFTLAVSILFSGFLALTLTPALCATLLKPINPQHAHTDTGFFARFNRFFKRLTARYSRLSVALVSRAGRVMLVYLALLALLGYSYLRLPESFVPPEDQGHYILNVQLPAGATAQRTQKVVEQVEAYMLEQPATQATTMIMGWSFSGVGQNAALGFSTLKDWSERTSEQSVSAEVAALNTQFANFAEAQIMAVSPPPIAGLGSAGGFSLRLQDRAGLGREALTAARDQLLYKAYTSPLLMYAMVEGLEDAPQIRLTLDRAKAQALGVRFETISQTLATAFGSNIVGDFANQGRLQRVVVQADSSQRMTPESVLNLFVVNNQGDQVPFKAFATIDWEKGPVQISRYNGYPSFKIAGEAAPGVSSGDAMRELERLMADLPRGIGYEWTGLSLEEKSSGAQAPLLLGLSFLVVLLLLVALYESWSLPFAVMLIVPLGALGSVLAVTFLDMPNDVYFKVGLITIIGLSAKNAILIVEFAKSLTQQGMALKEAAITAARMRFRPIVMTSMAFILGVVPLAIATGAGAASQRAIGTGVIGGMLAATVLGVLLVPVFYVWVLSVFKKQA